MFNNDLTNVAYNRVGVDTMCAFYFAVHHHKPFQDMVNRLQKQLDQQSESLRLPQIDQDLTTGLLQDYHNVQLCKEARAASQRLKIALSRIENGDQHLPPWGPPLLPRDTPIEESDAWIFPVPWMVMAGDHSVDVIRAAKATPEDPVIRSRMVLIGSVARADLPPPTSPFWSLDREYSAPATQTCLKMARLGARLALSRPRNAPQPTQSEAARLPSMMAQLNNLSTISATERPARTSGTVNRPNTAQESRQYIPPPISSTLRTDPTSSTPSSAQVPATARTNTLPVRRPPAAPQRRSPPTSARPRNPAVPHLPIAARISAGNAGRAGSPRTPTRRRDEPESTSSKALTARADERQLQPGKPKPSETANAASSGTGRLWPRWGTGASSSSSSSSTSPVVPNRSGDQPSARTSPRSTKEGGKLGRR